MRYRITTVRNNENGRVLYWLAEYRNNVFSPWKPVRDKNQFGQHESLNQASEAITEHYMKHNFERLVLFKEEFA